MANYMEIAQLTSQLDSAYGNSNYKTLLAVIKEKGYKVYRNSQGKHKLEPNPIIMFFNESVWGKSGGMTWGE